MFPTTYQLSLNKNYVRHWGVLEAVRELIQNALDSDSPFVFEFDREDDGKFTLTLASENSTLSPQSLLLGSTTKADSTGKIGSFGEGYKIALLVLTREGFPTSIHNGGKVWSPYFNWSAQFEDDLLCIEETTAPFKRAGLAFLVSGLSPENVAQIRESCLQMQDQIGGIHRTSKGDILLQKPGQLFVGGLFICKTQMKFGYNIKPQFMRLERDRKTVDEFDLKMLAKEMWFETKMYDDVAAMIESEVPDLEYAQYGSPELVKEACYALFRSKNPGKLVAESAEDVREKVKSGMTEYVYAGANFGTVVRGSRSYVNQPRLPVATPHSKLQAWFDDARRHMHADVVRSFRPLLEESRRWKP